jgi:Na+/phosphate symporter
LKKASQSYNRNTLAKLGEDEMEQMKILAKNKSINKQLNRYGSKNLNMSSSSENILIMSVLKKLEGLTEPTRYE